VIDFLPKRITSRIWPEPNSGCWLWSGTTEGSGYGVTRKGTREIRVHRLVFEAVKGPIPDGMLVCHRCDNRVCCNPDHLFLGTNAENMADMSRKSRSAKKLTPERVAEIRERYQSGKPQSALAAEYGLSGSTISDLCTGKSWAFAPGDTTRISLDSRRPRGALHHSARLAQLEAAAGKKAGA